MLRALVLSTLLCLGCGNDDSSGDDGSSGGTSSGGTASGGTASGGTASGGTASGGTSSGGTAGGGSTGTGGSGGGGALEPRCECAGECLTEEEVAQVHCAAATVSRAPAGGDCNLRRYVVEGIDYAIYFFFSDSGALLRTERAQAGEERCEGGEPVDACPDGERFAAEICEICDGAGLGNPGELPACE